MSDLDKQVTAIFSVQFVRCDIKHSPDLHDICAQSQIKGRIINSSMLFADRVGSTMTKIATGNEDTLCVLYSIFIQFVELKISWIQDSLDFTTTQNVRY